MGSNMNIPAICRRYLTPINPIKKELVLPISTRSGDVSYRISRLSA